MLPMPLHRRSHLLRVLAPCALAVALSGCAVGPDFRSPAPDSPASWTQWRGSDAGLGGTASTDPLPAGEWWRAYHDPVLDELQRRARDAAPDLQTAALHLAQARVQRRAVQAQTLPQANLSGGVSRQRQSESGASTRLLDVVGGDQSDTLKKVLSEPFDLYQAGVDVSWELDLWGRVRRSIEAADASVEEQAALLEMTRLSTAGDVATAYFALRTTQRQIALVQEDIAAAAERTAIIDARVSGGLTDHMDSDRQQAELAGLRASLPALQANEGTQANQLTLLLGEKPGALSALMQTTPTMPAALPDLSLGLPSEVALRRPDIRAAASRLHEATAQIGVARADLYPSIRLGGKFGYESTTSGSLGDWASRTWSIGPVLDLPLFDHGRRVSIVKLRELQQQEAAVAYQHTVLRAWKEIDDALTSFTSLQQQRGELLTRAARASDAYALAQAKFSAGTVDFLTVIEAQRMHIQARSDLSQNDGRIASAFAQINRAVGNVAVAQ
ncbi:efflux transporter outer membrane subunit [Stenotrophomonas sp. Sm10]|uniref:efflux transporter outer membrane subunit n=1 Tax=Stenotrophomonas sp. Sm10 TaxID=3002754 RepID=UPI0027E4EE45|nr:efflux transporter outer membrane subunit [Stenotrophomonas sp. Sm10]MDQ7310554.1 efflux transporter outer membrane subunit [Stenotrophomonas sp. Sm10]